MVYYIMYFKYIFEFFHILNIRRVVKIGVEKVRHQTFGDGGSISVDY
jgi:hypothetical protein